ncbi:hypothetical protein BO78DRAFT_400469 [Aspergillus sclerotiicarbonarius CBS 121057]|uniref:Uncharacterized protein n=1 Tax=Aspergillus sclerotiicarbonarius (strain CBS 121057 / IBT 28362) TaxID=1448318 RepID=A0A319E7I0_ASPSB|nr:hypothetical protein BO78DRAFT_400469 [Aspergillus sclerotiicarbonarius CBS 121057]
MYLHVAYTYARHTPPSNNPGIQFMHDHSTLPPFHPTQPNQKSPFSPTSPVQMAHDNPTPWYQPTTNYPTVGAKKKEKKESKKKKEKEGEKERNNPPFARKLAQ